MSIYDEAHRDVQDIVRAAEERATKRVLEAAVPKIKKLIEREIVGLEEPEELADPDVIVSEPDADGNVTVSLTPAATASPDAAAPAPGAVQLPPPPGAPQSVPVPAVPVPPPPSIPDPTVVNAEASAIEAEVRDLCDEAAQLAEQRKPSASLSERRADVQFRIADMYRYVNACPVLGGARQKLTEALARSLAELAAGENRMRSRLRENAITLSITGMPEDLDLTNLGVEISDSGEGEGDDSAGQAGADDDSGELELDMGDDGDGKNEAATLSDDEIVEIDDVELEEACRMAEESRPDNRGQGPGDPDNFGDGRDEGDPLDVNIVTEKRLVAEKLAALRSGDMRLYRERRAQLDRLRESRLRGRAPARPRRGSSIAESARSVSRPSSREKQLTAELREANLKNAKLTHIARVSQRGDLSEAQKRAIATRITEARDVRAVKLVYDSAVKAAGAARTRLRESRILGSSSRPARSGASSATLNESVDAARWSQLAGLGSR